MSADDPPGLVEREVQGDRQHGGEQGGEQGLADDDADGDAADAESDDDGRGEIDPAGGDEGNGQLGEGAFAEEDLADLEDDGARCEEQQRVEAERPGAAGILEEPDAPGGEQSLRRVAGEQGGEAAEREKGFGPGALEGPAVQGHQFAGQQDGGQEEVFGGAVLGHGLPPGRAAARKSGGGIRTMTCSSERKSRSGSASALGRAPRPMLTDVTLPRLRPRGTPLIGSSVVRTVAPFSTGVSPPNHLIRPICPDVPS